MNPIFSAALDVQAFCREQEWRFCFIGGLAVQRWGEPRLTQDVDLTVLTGFGREERYVDALLGRFAPRRSDAHDFALRYRVVLVRSSSGVPVDIALGAMPFEERTVQRATPFSIGAEVTLLTCGPEDLIVLKAFAGRERDWLDIEGILLRQQGRLDEGLIWTELTPLLELKEEPGSADRLQAMLDRARRGPGLRP